MYIGIDRLYIIFDMIEHVFYLLKSSKIKSTHKLCIDIGKNLLDKCENTLFTVLICYGDVRTIQSTVASRDIKLFCKCIFIPYN